MILNHTSKILQKDIHCKSLLVKASIVNMFLSAYEVNEPVSIAGAFTENVK